MHSFSTFASSCHNISFLLLLKIMGFQKQPPEVFYKKGVLRIFTKFTGKDLCKSLFFNKVAGLRAATLLKKKLQHRYFPVKFIKFLRNLFYRTPPGDCFQVLQLYFSVWHIESKTNLQTTIQFLKWVYCLGLNIQFPFS